MAEVSSPPPFVIEKGQERLRRSLSYRASRDSRTPASVFHLISATKE
jgi:hypothetical protein